MIIKSLNTDKYQNHVSRMYLEDNDGHTIRVVAKYDLVLNTPYEIRISFLDKNEVVTGYYNIYYHPKEAEIKQKLYKWQKGKVDEILNFLLETHYKM